MKPKYFIILFLFIVASCSYLPDWLGSDEEEKLKGERISVMLGETELKPDPVMKFRDMNLPAAALNNSFLSNEQVSQHLALPAQLKRFSQNSLSEEPPRDYLLPSNAMVADNKIYAIDGEGILHAFAIDSLELLWTFKTINDGKYFISGGITYYKDKIFVTTSSKKIYVLNADSGKLVWQKTVRAPIKSSPVVKDDVIVFTSTANEAFALSTADGTILWSYAGIISDLGIVGTANPVISDNIVVVPFSSGEVFAINTDYGRPIWGDSLSTRRSTALPLISIADINATPVIHDGIVFLSSTEGVLSAKALHNGSVMWERDIAVTSTPWVSGSYIFIITDKSEIAAVHTPDGKIKWVTPLQKFEDEQGKKGKINYAGPVLAGGRLLITGSNGKINEISPQDGNIINQIEIDDKVFMRPIVANNKMFLLSNDVRLTGYE